MKIGKLHNSNPKIHKYDSSCFLPQLFYLLLLSSFALQRFPLTYYFPPRYRHRCPILKSSVQEEIEIPSSKWHLKVQNRIFLGNTDKLHKRCKIESGNLLVSIDDCCYLQK